MRMEIEGWYPYYIKEKLIAYYIISAAHWNINKTELPYKENNDLEMSMRNKIFSSFYHKKNFFSNNKCKNLAKDKMASFAYTSEI